MDASINKQNNSNVAGHCFNAASNILDIGLAREIHLIELQNTQAFIAHKEHEVSVYENARSLIECQAPGDRCMVFLADNLFVMRTREQALEILDRQIEAFQTALKYLRQEMASLNEKVALMERLNITNDGLVEIREPENEDKEGSGKIKGKRIQHSPTKKSPPSPNKSLSKPCSKNDEMDRINDEIDQILKREENNEDNNKINEKSKEDNTKPTRPKGVSEKVFFGIMRGLSNFVIRWN
ncbi:unnamed protein product [Meloidogyne enterolobii]|uniref:Uncharacterized protein n=1 Tax=Meloidogyne enterolobii TaxID=390850 RepID=A0ACB1AJP3_MELEN